MLRRAPPAGPPGRAGTWHAALPVALVFLMLSLTALVALPVMMERRVAAVRADRAATAEPARRLVRDVQAAQARQMSALRGFAITEAPAFLKSYEMAREAEDAASSRLQPIARQLAPEVHEAYVELATSAGRWHESVDETGLVEGQAVPAEYVERVPFEESLYRDALEAASSLEQAVVEVLDRQDAEIRTAEQRQRVLTIVLSLLGMTALLVVGWFAHRLQTMARRLGRRAEEETAFRQSAEALSSALSVEDAMSRLARSSLAAVSADGAFVERLRPDSNEIEVMAVAGTGTPRLGSRVAAPDSLTQVLVERNEPVLATDVSVVGPLVAPYLGRACERCQILGSVLLSEDDAALGTLVLLRPADRPPFGEEHQGRARVLADLASLALRRGLAMEESERRRDEVETLMHSKARLMRGLSHDLKNPLSAIDGYADLLGMREELSEEAREQVTRMRRAVAQAIRIIDDVLELAQAETGQLTIEPGRVELANLIEQVVEDQRPAAERARLTIRTEVPRGLPEVETDGDRVRQVLGNLVSNAIKYTPEGGEVEVRAGPRDDHAPHPGHWVAIDVRDTGPGIPAEDQARIFEEFYRRDEKKDTPGTGLGLAIAQRIARLLGGEITLRSEPGAGSTFTLWIPVSGFRMRSRAA